MKEIETFLHNLKYNER